MSLLDTLLLSLKMFLTKGFGLSVNVEKQFKRL